MQNEDQFLRRADGSIYGVRADGMSALICDKCGQELKPGSKVTIIDILEDKIDGPRIIVDIAHVECPEPVQ